MRIFISHAASDRDFARKLTKTLRASGHRIVNPEEEFLPGDNWALKLGQALDSAEAMVVLLSPDALASRFVRNEIDYAIASPRFRERFIPVMVRKTTDYPWILKRIKIMPFKPEKIAARLGDKVSQRKAAALATHEAA